MDHLDFGVAPGLSLRPDVLDPVSYWYGDGEKTEDVYPVVFRLPKGRGFLAGACDTCCSPAEVPFYAGIDRTVWETEDDAARYARDEADRLASILADDGNTWLEAQRQGYNDGENGEEASPPSDEHFAEAYMEEYRLGQKHALAVADRIRGRTA